MREAVKQYPAEPHAHAYVVELLAQKGEPIDAAARAARTAIPQGADARVALAGALAAGSQRLRPLAACFRVKALLAEASSLVDEALKLKPGDTAALRVRTRIEQLRKASERG